MSGCALELATAVGTLRLQAVSEAAARAAWELVQQRLADGRRSCGERVELDLGGDTRAAWLKADRLRGGARLRHGLRAALRLRPVPRLCEQQNLVWLRERGFQAPRPLAAGVLTLRGLPALEWLATELVPHARTLQERLADERDTPERAALLDELAREVARMHALGFVHRDLYPRNVLVLERGDPARIVFLDAWAGGPGPGLRGPAYDLGALLLEGAELMTAAEQRAFFARYLEQRAAHGRPIGAGRGAERRFLERVARERRRLARRLARRPHERRGRPAPRLEWHAPLGPAPSPGVSPARSASAPRTEQESAR